MKSLSEIKLSTMSARNEYKFHDLDIVIRKGCKTGFYWLVVYRNNTQIARAFKNSLKAIRQLINSLLSLQLSASKNPLKTSILACGVGYCYLSGYLMPAHWPELAVISGLAFVLSMLFSIVEFEGLTNEYI